ncbi:hypothetical protein BG004_004616 [Podila humilis]|nr:hypothetical protein BG004_004616 [Podila humilis]
MPEGWRPYVIHYSALKKQIRAIVRELHDKRLPSPVTTNLSKSTSGDVERMEYSFDDGGKRMKSCIKVELHNLRPSELVLDEKESSKLSAQHRLFPDSMIPPSRLSVQEQTLMNRDKERSEGTQPLDNLKFSFASVVSEETSLITASSTTPTRLMMSHRPNSGATYCFCSDSGLETAITIGTQSSSSSLTYNRSPSSQPSPLPDMGSPTLSVLPPGQTDEEPMESLVTPGALSEPLSSTSGYVNPSNRNRNLYQSKSDVFLVEEDGKRMLIIELMEDTAFFDQLGKEITQLSKLQQTNKQELESKVEDLSNVLSVASSPYNKDMYTWREIFKIYQDAQVFVSDQESNRSTRSSEKALGQFQWFLKEIERAKLIPNFKQAKSKTAFSTFFRINSELITMLQFKELNHMAMTKILEQHDKRTNLTCLVKAQRKNLHHCPICRRTNSILNANASNLDASLSNFMSLYFPKEVKDKQKDSMLEQAAEETVALTGQHSADSPDTACVMM